MLHLAHIHSTTEMESVKRGLLTSLLWGPGGTEIHIRGSVESTGGRKLK